MQGGGDDAGRAADVVAVQETLDQLRCLWLLRLGEPVQGRQRDALIGIAAVVIPLGIVLLVLTDEIGEVATLIAASLIAVSILGLASFAAYKR